MDVTPPTMTDPTPPTASDADTVAGLNGEPARCAATSKRTGERCGAPAVSGRQTCRAHGGTSPRGPAHPAWKHGRFSKALGAARAADFEAAMDDPDLGSLRSTLALLDVRVAELLAEAYGPDGSGGLSVRHLRQTWARVVAAFQAEDADRLDAALEAHAEAMEGATAAADAWAELADVLDKRRKAAGTASLAENRADRAVSSERFDAVLGYLFDAVVRHVGALPQGQAALRGLARDFEAVLRPDRTRGEA